MEREKRSIPGGRGTRTPRCLFVKGNTRLGVRTSLDINIEGVGPQAGQQSGKNIEYMGIE